MLPLRDRADLGVMAIKGYTVLPKAPASRTLVGVSYPSAGM